MKNLFIQVTSSTNFSFSRINLKALPKSSKAVGLIATVQFIKALPGLKQWLERQGKQALINKNGQIVGCNISNATKIQDKVSCFLYVGSGKFHPLAVALSLKQPKPIFLYNPITEEFSRLNEKDIAQVQARKKTARVKFISAKIFGILVSTKPGQQRLKQAKALRTKLEKQGKKVYFFLFNDFDINQLENFPRVECWINTACPGLSLEQPFIWFEDIKI